MTNGSKVLIDILLFALLTIYLIPKTISVLETALYTETDFCPASEGFVTFIFAIFQKCKKKFAAKFYRLKSVRNKVFYVS